MPPILCPTIIGRDEVLGKLEAAVTEGRSGRGGVTVVLGEAGIGKSRLVREVAEAAVRRGLAVLSGRAVDSDSPVAFRPLSHALLGRFRVSGPPESPELRPLRGALGRLVPEWQDQELPAIEQSVVLVAEALVRLLRVVACDGSCLLILEDLHWADAETLAVIEYLADTLASQPVVCIVTLRGDETTPAFALVRSLTARRAVTAIELGPLDDAAVDQMAEACLGMTDLPPMLAEPLRAWAEGVPFLVEELLAAWVEAGVLRPGPSGRWTVASPIVPMLPATFADSVRSRVSALGDDARRVLEAAAVLGRRFDWALLAPLTGLSQEAVISELRACLNAQLISAEADTTQPAFRFRHALTRDAIVGDLLRPERTELFARALRAVEDAHPTLAGPWCELAAELAEACGDTERAARLLHIAGRRALDQGALATAEAALERARVMPVSSQVAMAIDETLTEVLSLAGKVERAIEVGTTLLASREAQAAPTVRRAEVVLRLARAMASSGSWAEASEQIAAARELSSGGDPSLAARTDALAAHVALGESRFEEAVRMAESALRMAEASGVPAVACEALEVIGRRARLHDLAEAEMWFERSRSVAEDHGLTLWRIRALHELASIDVLRTVRLDRLTAARDLAYQSGALMTAAHLDLHICLVLAFHFDSKEGLDVGRRCEEAARRFHLVALLPMALLRQAQCHAIGGDQESMEQAIGKSHAAAGENPDVSAGAWGQCRATLSLLGERREQALEELEAGAALLRDRPEALPWTFRGLWALLRTTEDVDGSGARAELRSSGVTAMPFHRGILGYADAVASGRAGACEEAEAAFAAAETEMAAMAGRGGYGHVARRLVAECALRDGWGDPASWLREAVVFFEDRGQYRVASSCRSLLRDAGVALPRRQRSDRAVSPALRVLGVTAREADVLALVAERLSNKEIGLRLYVSPRTVDKHVQRLLAKTGRKRRSDLVAIAGEARVGGADPSPGAEVSGGRAPPVERPSAGSGPRG
ncbi:MAG: helix-turn-helix transcriptional regulator [Acidimicrobiales bacterium]